MAISDLVSLVIYCTTAMIPWFAGAVPGHITSMTRQTSAVVKRASMIATARSSSRGSLHSAGTDR